MAIALSEGLSLCLPMHAQLVMQKCCVLILCNMCTYDLPDMYAISSQALSMHIKNRNIKTHKVVSHATNKSRNLTTTLIYLHEQLTLIEHS